MRMLPALGHTYSIEVPVLYLYPRNIHPRSIEDTVYNRLASLALFFRQRLGLDTQRCVCASATLLAQGTWVDAQD
jgi:hypothetical protein